MKRMKRTLWSLFLVLLLGLGLIACGKKQEAPVSDTIEDVPSQVEVVVEEPEEVVEEAPPEETAYGSEEEAFSEIGYDGMYTTKEDVALYLHVYGELPMNFITKSEAAKLGWEGGSLEPYAPGMCIGGDRFGNYEGKLPVQEGYHECDINTMGADSRGAERLVYSDSGNIYYTNDHYNTFEQLYRATEDQ